MNNDDCIAYTAIRTNALVFAALSRLPVTHCQTLLTAISNQSERHRFDPYDNSLSIQKDQPKDY